MQEFCIKTNKPQNYQSLNRIELGERLNVFSPYNIKGKKRLTNYGVLMFTSNPEKYIPGAFVHILIETYNSNEKIRKPYDFYGPIWIQIQKVWDIFDTFVIQESFTKPGWLNKKLKNYPQKALREAAANAIFHKRYDLFREVRIYVTTEDVCFTNFNRPLLPVTIKDLNEKPRIRSNSYINGELKEPLYTLGFIEKEGTGIEDIKNALLENGNPDIVYDIDGDENNFTSATIYANKEFVEQMKKYELNEVKSDENIDIKLPKNQQIVYETILNNPGLRIPALSGICLLKNTSVENAIRRLKEKNLIEYIGTSKNGGFYPKSTD